MRRDSAGKAELAKEGAQSSLIAGDAFVTTRQESAISALTYKPEMHGPPAYFTDDEYYEKLDKELTWLASMRDEGVRRIAARTVGLSAEAQQDIVQKVDELRRQEHLDD